MEKTERRARSLRGWIVRAVALAMVTLLCVTSMTAQAAEPAPGDAPTTRIVSLMPSMTEIVFAIGAGDQVVGVSDYCLWPAEAQAKPHVGGLMNPNMEAILLLRPTTVLLHNGQGEFAARLKRANVEAQLIPADTLADVYASIANMGALTGQTTDAAELSRKIQSGIAGENTTSPPSVLLVVARDGDSLRGIYASGPRTHLGEILEATGGRNVLASADPRPSRPMGVEELILTNPDVIIDFSVPAGSDTDAENARLMKPWLKLATVKAVQHGHVYFVKDPHLSLPGPPMVDLADLFRRWLALAQKDAGSETKR
ncbi:hypothetical protein CVU37_06040 [candidate division BRC1 bacterium HGW-BRC1-1]|jgi:iron complex transport system substrate-binding protein|nr:MAG: hypothetical protein CVU37_06040 [candidate division BRC1 bacterium HGW-BRC1-1]